MSPLILLMMTYMFIVTYLIQLAILFMVYSFTSWVVNLWMMEQALMLKRPMVIIILAIASIASLAVIISITTADITYESENKFLNASLIVSMVVVVAKSILVRNKSTQRVDLFVIDIFYYTQPITYYILIFNCPWDLMF